MTNTLQDAMFQQLKSKAIFEQAKSYAGAYTDGVMQRDVYPKDAAIEDLEQFSEPMPVHRGDASDILSLLHKVGSPATLPTLGGRYFGFVTGSVIPVALAAKWLSDVWDQNPAMYVLSPVSAKLESLCQNWLVDLFGLPKNTVAGFVSGSSMATFCGLAAARYHLLKQAGWDVNTKGLNGAPKLRIIASRQIHGTVIKAAALLGLGVDSFEWVDMDAEGRIIAENMPKLDERCIVIGQAGNVNSGAFEDFEIICKAARKAGAWVHVDGAFGLWAAATTRLKHLTKGVNLAHSWSVDGHKTLNAPYDNGIILCTEPDAMVNALQLSGDYIVHSPKRDGMLFTPEMSRRAHGTELWAALKYLGKDGVDELVCGLHDRAVQMADELRVAGFEIMNEVVFNQVMVACETDDITNQTMANVQMSGECWAGGSKWHGRQVIRISICSWATTKADITRSCRAFIDARAMANA
ncbi:MAG: pyridoxal-dependent decarboxylase [Robiginitomaculum sp.]|nr:pyridoxal-dependent decarboxylase [Robiginitomaculum sp.]